MEQIDYNLLFRWFVGLAMDDPVWDASTFSKNRDRLLQADVAQALHGAAVEPATGEAAAVDRALLGRRHADRRLGLDEELCAEGRLRRTARRRRNGERNFRKEKRSNETHASTTDPDAQLFRKGNGQSSRCASWAMP